MVSMALSLPFSFVANLGPPRGSSVLFGLFFKNRFSCICGNPPPVPQVPVPRSGLAAVRAWQMCAEHWTWKKWGAYGCRSRWEREKQRPEAGPGRGRAGRAEESVSREASPLGVGGANAECVHASVYMVCAQHAHWKAPCYIIFLAS